MSQPDETRIGIIAGAVAATIVTLAALVYAVNQYYDFTVEEEVLHKVLEPVSAMLTKQRAAEDKTLASYQWVDQSKGVLRIPIERATELVLRDATANGGVIPLPVPPPPPAPAAAPNSVDGGVVPATGTPPKTGTDPKANAPKTAAPKAPAPTTATPKAAPAKTESDK